MGQAEIISAMSSNNADLGGLWAPNIYTMEEKAGAKVICSGKDTGTVIPGALVVRADYAKEQPQNVAKFLAVYLRAWKWMNAHRPEAIAMMKKFYDLGGVTISQASMEKEFDTRPTFDLAGQLKVMNRANGPSDVDKWMTQISDFMKSTGTLPRFRRPRDYVTDEYLQHGRSRSQAQGIRQPHQLRDGPMRAGRYEPSRVFVGGATFAVLVVLWYVGTSLTQIIPPVYFPTPAEVLRRCGRSRSRAMPTAGCTSISSTAASWC